MSIGPGRLAIAAPAEAVKRREKGAIRNAVGRYRVLLRRLFHLRKAMGIPIRRLPVSMLFFAGYCAAVGRGFAAGRSGAPEPFADF